jgi:hypothetical protein
MMLFNRLIARGWSSVYGWTPIQFARVCTGFRWSDGVPQDPSGHQRLYFIDLHGFF